MTSRVRINLTGKQPATPATTPAAEPVTYPKPTSRVRINLTGKHSK